MNTAQKLYNVGAYIRLSVKDTDYKDDSQSIESQQQILSQFISMMPGWIEQKFYIDNGFSGGNFDRPAFQEMISDIRSGKINLLLVKDLSRFGRNYLETGKYLEEELPALGCRFVALMDNVDTEDGENDIIPFINGLNDYYLKNLSDRIKTVRTAKAKDGQFLASETPYGYTKSKEAKNRLIIDEPAAEIVRKIYEMRVSGMGYYSICKYLNERNITTPRWHFYISENRQAPREFSKAWQASCLKRILESEIYLGHTIHNQRKTISHRSKKQVRRDKSEWLRVENTHEPIIEKSVWEAVQAINQEATAKVAHHRQKQSSLFSKMLVCSNCGKTLIPLVDSKRSKKGKVYTSYYCSTYSSSCGTLCTRHSIPETVLKQIILGAVKNISEQITLNESRMLEQLQERLIGTAKRQNTAKQKHDLEQKLHSIEMQTAKLYEDRCEGIISDERFGEMITSLEDKRKVLEIELSNLNQSTSVREQKLADIENWIRLIKEKSSIEDLDRETLEVLIDRIEVGESEVVDGEKRRDIRVYYKFVGLVN